MTNLTITVDGRYAGGDEARHAVDAILRLSDEAGGYSGPGGRSWVRDDLYVERLGRARSRPADET